MLTMYSSTHDRVVKTYVVSKANRLYLRHNSFKEFIPIVIALKAMGLTADKEILQLICGSDERYQEAFGVSLEEAAKEKTFTPVKHSNGLVPEYLQTRPRMTADPTRSLLQAT